MVDLSGVIAVNKTSIGIALIAESWHDSTNTPESGVSIGNRTNSKKTGGRCRD